MTPSLSKHPADATLSEALAVLRSTWTPHLDLIFRGQYSFWLGSAISASRFDSIDGFLNTLLSTLQSRCTASASCPYAKALKQIVQRTSLTAAEVALIDFSKPPTTWPRVDEIVRQLRNHYSAILAIPVIDTTPLSIPWEILRLQNVYSDDSKEPDAEHRIVAAMIEESFLSDLVTTNWDPLLEKAYSGCRAGKTDELEVIAANDDLSRHNHGSAPRLFKIHGDARKSVADPTHYLQFMVATSDEIAKWERAAGPIAEASRALLRERPSMFIGLSGQDGNLKTLFANVEAGRSSSFALTPCRVVFCTTDLSSDHHAILKLIYGEETYTGNAQELVKEAALPLYSKPLLGTIYLLGLKAKIAALLQLGEAEIATPFTDMALSSLEYAEQRLCAVFDSILPADARWRAIADDASGFIGRLMALYQNQALHPDRRAYSPLSTCNLAKITASSPAAMGHLHWLFLAMSCILEGEKRGYWNVELPLAHDSSHGQVVLRKGSNALSIFFVDRAMYRSRLEKQVLNPTPSPNPVVVLYPAEAIPSSIARVPTRALPGGSPDPDDVTEISLQELLEGATTQDDLVDAFHKEISTARTTW
jgi:hypothetical protein